MVRSPPSAALTTFQPAPTGPRRYSSGIRTPSRNTSLKSTSPVMWMSGRTNTPGASIGHAKHVMPCRFGTSGSVRATSNPNCE
ncbi:unannotated protein [freshwater metagenome]|uniref:Unannotated protein n=1 Tax=freshwater metagenome TaxID=449393 RepID=A0A6J7I3B1_9ZZZZ